MSDTSISNFHLYKLLKADPKFAIYDVRKKPAFDQDPATLPAAQWQIHSDVKHWAANLPRNHRIVVYCVHGHEVSQNTAKALCDMGFDACYLRDGIVGWKQAGLPVEGAIKK